MMNSQIRHYGIVVLDIKKSLLFWSLLGFKVKKEKTEYGDTIDRMLAFSNAKIKTFKLINKNKDIVELINFINPKVQKNQLQTNCSGPTHIALSVKQIGKLYLKLVKNKIQFNCRPTLSKDKKVMVTYCKTPEGAFLELVEALV